MTKDSGGTVDGEAPGPGKKERDVSSDPMVANDLERDETSSPGKEERGEAGGGDCETPVDLDAAHDRAS